MAKATVRTTTSLRLESHLADPFDVSLLRDFVKLLDEHQIDGRLIVKSRNDSRQLTQLYVEVVDSSSYPAVPPPSATPLGADQVAGRPGSYPDPLTAP